MIACPVVGKRKSAEICEAFVKGAPRGALGTVFYGVDESNLTAWHEAKAAGDVYYCDNSFFDESRQRYFRVAKNSLQHSGLGHSDGERFKRLGIQIRPWREGDHIVLCPQSDHFMHKIAGCQGDWTFDTVKVLTAITPRALRVRSWSADKAKLSATLLADLERAHALVTWSSAAAVTAAINGIRTVSMGESAARPVGGKIEDIEKLPTPDREEWASVLADNQFTLEEMRSGEAWALLNRN